MAIGVYGYYQELGVAGAAAFVFWGIAAVTLHELAHGWAAIWQGDDTPRIYRRMTWNPLVHMGWMSIIMLLLVGIFWGMMPTDPSKYRWGRQGRIIVSGAGPAMNLLLAILCWTAYGVAVGLGGRVAGEEATVVDRVAQFALIGGALNGMLALFNMLPIPPFDGASVLAGFSRRFYSETSVFPTVLYDTPFGECLPAADGTVSIKTYDSGGATYRSWFPAFQRTNHTGTLTLPDGTTTIPYRAYRQTP